MAKKNKYKTLPKSTTSAIKLDAIDMISRSGVEIMPIAVTFVSREEQLNIYKKDLEKFKEMLNGTETDYDFMVDDITRNVYSNWFRNFLKFAKERLEAS